MKVLVVLSTLVAFTAAAALTRAELDQLETFDFDSLLANDELRNITFNCFLKKGDCGVYKELSELALRVLKNQCAECLPAQRTTYDRLLKLLQEKYEPYYNELMKVVAARKE